MEMEELMGNPNPITLENNDDRSLVAKNLAYVDLGKLC